MKAFPCSAVLVACIAIAGCGSSGGKSDGGGGSGGGGAGTGGTNVDAAANGSVCPFTACGGNLVGTWRAASTCGSIPSAACPPSQAITSTQGGSEATYTFGSDGSFAFSATGSTTQSIRYPAACIATLDDAGITPACAALDEAFQKSIQMVDAGASITGLTIACAVDGNDTCLCTEHFTLASPLTSTGTYTVNGNQVTITAADGGVGDGGTNSPAEYCVSGNTLTLHSTGSSGSGTVVTLTR